MPQDGQVRNWGKWVFGADGPAAVLRVFDPYTLDGYAPLITCPTLVLDGENDFAGGGQASQLYEALRCRTRRSTCSDEDTRRSGRGRPGPRS